MKRLKKILININKERKEYPALITYETEKGLFVAFQLDQETTEIANNFFKIIFKDLTSLQLEYKIYCYNYKTNKIALTSEIQDPSDYYLIGSDYISIDRIIQKIKFIVDLKDFLIPLYTQINNKTYCLNERIIQIKKGIKNPKAMDLETYGLFLKEYNPDLYMKIISNSSHQ